MPPESTSPGTERPFCFPVVTRRWPQGPGQAAVDIPRGGAQRPGEHGSEAEAGAPAAGTGGPETDVSGWGEPRVPARPTAQHGGWGGRPVAGAPSCCVHLAPSLAAFGGVSAPLAGGLLSAGPGARGPGVWIGRLCLCFPQLALRRQALRGPSGSPEQARAPGALWGRCEGLAELTARHPEGAGTEEETGESQLRDLLPVLRGVPRTLVAPGAGTGVTGGGRRRGKEQRRGNPQPAPAWRPSPPASPSPGTAPTVPVTRPPAALCSVPRPGEGEGLA